ncbi:hypothetical protein WN943_014481 [Citrus x changshan-huyou]
MEVSLAQKLCGGTIVEVSNVEKAKNVERFKIEKHEDAPSYKHTKKNSTLHEHGKSKKWRLGSFSVFLRDANS